MLLRPSSVSSALCKEFDNCWTKEEQLLSQRNKSNNQWSFLNASTAWKAGNINTFSTTRTQNLILAFLTLAVKAKEENDAPKQQLLLNQFHHFCEH